MRTRKTSSSRDFIHTYMGLSPSRLSVLYISGYFAFASCAIHRSKSLNLSLFFFLEREREFKPSVSILHKPCVSLLTRSLSILHKPSVRTLTQAFCKYLTQALCKDSSVSILHKPCVSTLTQAFCKNSYPSLL